VSLSFASCLSDKVSFGAAICLIASGSASLREELRCCYVPHAPQRAVDHRNKERSSCPRHTARFICFQRLLRVFARHTVGGLLNADETCGQAVYRVGPAKQTCNPVTVVRHNAEWFNNSEPTTWSGRQLQCDCSPAPASCATCQTPLHA
jgi:hypothetical protein